MKNLLTITAVLVLVGLSCKKKDDPAPSNNSSSTTGTATTGGTTTGGTTGTPTSNATSFHGLLSVSSQTAVNGSQKTIWKEGNAFFSTTPVNIPGTNGVRLKRVSLNGDSLIYEKSNTQYYANAVTSLSGGKWEIEGANGIPSFTFNTTFSEPTCSNLDHIPAVLSKSVGLTISMTVNNSMSAHLYLFDESGTSAGTLPIFLTNGINNINITPAQLNMMTNTTNGTVIVYLSNKSNNVIRGKDFSFKKEITYNAKVEIKD